MITTIDTHLTIARRLTKLLDNQFQFAGTKVGLDAVIGLIPGVGDSVTFLMSFYLLWIAKQMKLPRMKQAEMWFYASSDFLIGIIPFVGYVVDIYYKANLKNLEILETYALQLRHRASAVVEGEIVK